MLDVRILVVDDDPAQREQLAGFLRDLGAEVREAGDGGEALQQVLSGSPDLVITDLRMPGMDGRELLGKIRESNPEIGVFIVTAYGTVEGAVACLKAGARDYLLKPLDLEEVEHQVRRAIQDRHLRRENRELKRRLGEIESIPGHEEFENLGSVLMTDPSPTRKLALGNPMQDLDRCLMPEPDQGETHPKTAPGLVGRLLKCRLDDLGHQGRVFS